MRPLRPPYHFAYAASTASQTPSEPDTSASPTKRTFQLCSNNLHLHLRFVRQCLRLRIMFTPRLNLWLGSLVLLIGTGMLEPIQADSHCRDFTPLGRPVAQSGDGTASSKWITVCHAGQVVAFNPERNVSDWVAFRLRKKDLLKSGVKRKNNFRGDDHIPPQHRVVPKDYENSGYDRGHLAPAASMKWSRCAMDDSFLMSNIAPQVGAKFNNGIWGVLERRMRQWACERGTLYIVTGPLYESKDGGVLVYDRDGDKVDDNGIIVSIPSHFFKIAFDPAAMEAIAFVLPNMKLEKSNLPKYITSIDKIEAMSGLDFLSDLPDHDEVAIEAKVQMDIWDVPSGGRCRIK